MPSFYKIPECPGEDIILTLNVCRLCWIWFMYFMSQNWLITHCLQPWSGLELTGVSEHAEACWAPCWSPTGSRGFGEDSRSFGGGGAGERMRTVKCVHFLRGVTVDRKMLLKCWSTDWSCGATRKQHWFSMLYICRTAIKRRCANVG